MKGRLPRFARNDMNKEVLAWFVTFVVKNRDRWQSWAGLKPAPTRRDRVPAFIAIHLRLHFLRGLRDLRGERLWIPAFAGMT